MKVHFGETLGKPTSLSLVFGAWLGMEWSLLAFMIYDGIIGAWMLDCWMQC